PATFGVAGMHRAARLADRTVRPDHPQARRRGRAPRPVRQQALARPHSRRLTVASRNPPRRGAAHVRTDLRSGAGRSELWEVAAVAEALPGDLDPLADA